MKGQSLLFNNWINSNLIYINDLLDEKGKLSKEFICKNLKCKVNWISELYTFKKGLSREWVKILSEENSRSSTVNITKEKVIWNNKYMDINIFMNKLFYNSMIKAKATNPVGFTNWSRYLNLDEKPDMSQIYSLIFQWKLIQFINPRKKLLTVWRLSNCSLCNFCQIEEDYIHLFMSCKYLSHFWKKVTELFKKVNFEIIISLKHLVLGYEIFDKEYFDFNYILTILGYSIYKSYYVSEQKTKAIDVYSLFVRELRSRLNVCKNIYSNVLFKKIQKCTEK